MFAYIYIRQCDKSIMSNPEHMPISNILKVKKEKDLDCC